jgi:C4-dicarboxylate-specific signal transduction histidine kinase
MPARDMPCGLGRSLQGALSSCFAGLQGYALAAMAHLHMNSTNPSPLSPTTPQGCTQLLREIDDAVASKMRDALEETSRQSLPAGQIIRHLREFVTRGETKKTSQGIRKLVEEARALALVGSRERGVRTVFEFAPEARMVLADGVQIQQVLIDLMRNAMEAMRESQRRVLIVQTSLDDHGRVVVEVAGTGAGIADEIAVQLFEPFMTAKPGGMGVGLSISKRIVESHGGEKKQTRTTVEARLSTLLFRQSRMLT